MAEYKGSGPHSDEIHQTESIPQSQPWQPLRSEEDYPPRRWLGLRKSSDRTRGLFAGWEGVASLGLSLPLSPPPASYLQRGWAGSSLEFLSPFVL